MYFNSCQASTCNETLKNCFQQINLNKDTKIGQQKPIKVFEIIKTSQQFYKFDDVIKYVICQNCHNFATKSPLQKFDPCFSMFLGAFFCVENMAEEGNKIFGGDWVSIETTHVFVGLLSILQLIKHEINFPLFSNTSTIIDQSHFHAIRQAKLNKRTIKKSFLVFHAPSLVAMVYILSFYKFGFLKFQLSNST